MSTLSLSSSQLVVLAVMSLTSTGLTPPSAPASKRAAMLDVRAAGNASEPTHPLFAQRSDLTTLREFERASEVMNDTQALAAVAAHENKLKKKRAASKKKAKDAVAPRGSLRARPSEIGSSAANSSAETEETVSSPFVKLTDNVTKGTGETEIVAASIASPSTIISTFILMYVPLAMAWSYYLHHGKQQVHFALLLPTTYCLIQIGQDLVNQSLAVALKSPMAITLLQGGAMMIVTFVWALVVEMPTLCRLGWEPIRAWMPTAMFFAAYQLVNHLVWWRCSLSERTVFTNLTPAATLVFELLVLPPSNGGPPGSFRSKMSLMLMVAGAVLFSIQYPDFTYAGISVASLMVIITIPYRLSQRWYFSQRPSMPIGALCCIDSFILTGPAFCMSKSNLDHFWATLFIWFEQPSIVIMLVASIFSFTAHHVASLMMLREGSATSYLVFNNLANFAVVGMGITFFGDNIMQTPLVITGLTICLGSGLWYAFELQPAGTWEKLVSTKLTKDDGFSSRDFTEKHKAIAATAARAASK